MPGPIGILRPSDSHDHPKTSTNSLAIISWQSAIPQSISASLHSVLRRRWLHEGRLTTGRRERPARPRSVRELFELAGSELVAEGQPQPGRLGTESVFFHP